MSSSSLVMAVFLCHPVHMLLFFLMLCSVHICSVFLVFIMWLQKL